MRTRLSPSFVVMVLALLLVAGGAGYAAGRITSAQIQDGTIQGRDIKNGTIPRVKLNKGCKGNEVRAFGGCVTKASRGPSSFQAAMDDCNQRNGRLPSLAELRWIGAHAGQFAWANGTANQYEFSGDYTTDSPIHPTALDQGGSFFGDASGSSFWHHCVTS